MPAMTMIQALRSAMDVMLGRDDNVVIYGQDVGYFGGVFRCTEGLQKKYGTSRVFDAPISDKAAVQKALATMTDFDAGGYRVNLRAGVRDSLRAPSEASGAARSISTT